jgi:hypothetical protein
MFIAFNNKSRSECIIRKTISYIVKRRLLEASVKAQRKEADIAFNKVRSKAKADYDSDVTESLTAYNTAVARAKEIVVDVLDDPWVLLLFLYLYLI